ncbi:MAG: hypothetical protein PHQ12_08180 [Chthoniobacteraceae bacterium]|nr:hypothetical protein [Chthoniobacteraceae bacterium]
MILILCAAFHLPLAALAQDTRGLNPPQPSSSVSIQQADKAQRALIEALGTKAEERTRYLLFATGFSFFIGAFCGYWAQNNYRNPVVWFFAGFVFSVVALAVILWLTYKNRRHKHYRRVMAYWHF